MNIETIKAKQAELEKLIEQLQSQTTIIKINPITIELHPGEHYAGAVLDADGNHLHDLILLPKRHGKHLTWKAALDWAEEVGGALPTRQEQSLIFANCKMHLEGGCHWSCEEYEEYEDKTFYAWGCNFRSGEQDRIHTSYELPAVAVRRV